MDALDVSRWQFGITTVYHFIFVPLTIGLAPLIAAMQTAWVVTGNTAWYRLTRFFGKLFLINFARPSVISHSKDCRWMAIRSGMGRISGILPKESRREAEVRGSLNRRPSPFAGSRCGGGCDGGWARQSPG